MCLSLLWRGASLFHISDQPIDRESLHQNLTNTEAGAIVVFEGWVRNHNEGKKVTSLEYQVYQALALKEGLKILAEAKEKFNLHNIVSVHREGHLKLGEVAIWIGATASHRDDAFKATRFVIDEIKYRLPVWKKEHYASEDSKWVFCQHHHHHVHFNESDYYQKQSGLINQEKLKKAHVLVIGAGGLGCPVLVSLAMAGVGSITIVDPDHISISNIHRQFLYSTNLVGESKAKVAKRRLIELNPFIHVEAKVQYFEPSHVEGFQLVLDCTDNMATKYLIHDACFKYQIPFISAGVFKYEGQIRTFVPGKGCLRCHGGETPDDSKLGNCNDFGVLGATTNVLGSLEAGQAIELLTQGTNETLGSTLYLNLKTLTQVKIRNNLNTDCRFCSGDFELAHTDLEILKIGDERVIDIREMSDEAVMNLNFDSRKVVLCCHRGIRSKKMALSLRAQGHYQIYSLKGGSR